MINLGKQHKPAQLDHKKRRRQSWLADEEEINDCARNQNHLTVDADERNKRLSQLEEDTVALRDIFANLGELVNDQRETVKSIADFTDDIQIHVHEGSRLIKQAEVHQRKSRKKKLIVIVISGIIILILIVIIIHYLK